MRDHTVTRSADGKKFYILSTDLSLCYGMRSQYHGSWDEIGRKGSHFLSLWESEDLVHWTEQRLIPVGTERLGCCWAPDILAEKDGSFLLHWSSPVVDDDYAKKRIFCRRTRDFANFRRADAEFSFPYGFKHGTILKITDEEYERIRSFDFAAEEQGSPC